MLGPFVHGGVPSYCASSSDVFGLILSVFQPKPKSPASSSSLPSASSALHEMAKKFPEVQPGGSLILAWQIKGKKVLVVGGGEVSRPLFYTWSPSIITCLDI